VHTPSAETPKSAQRPSTSSLSVRTTSDTCIGTELHKISYQSIMESMTDINIQVYIHEHKFIFTYLYILITIYTCVGAAYNFVSIYHGS
jgi:hypothetical protein